MKRLYTIINMLLLLSTSVALAQEQPSLREKANQLYNKFEYANAAKIYAKLADTKKPKLNDLERLATCYEAINDYEAAETWYSRVVQDSASKVDNLLKYGSVLRSNARYAEAKKILQRYLAKTNDGKSVNVEIAGCDSAILWMQNPTLHKIKNEQFVNTNLAEFGTFVNQNKVFYTAEYALVKEKDGRTGNPFLSICNAVRDNDNTLSNVVIDPSGYNKNNWHTGPIALNKAGNVAYVTKTYEGRGGEIFKKGKVNYRTKNLELNIYRLESGDWKIKAFPYNDVEKYSVGHATLSPDEQTLYFVSDMPGGLGGTDIWYCALETDGSWGQPRNLGAQVNTVGDEMFPNVAENGTLYFSSNGLPGMGGLDIFRSTGSRNNWAIRKNLRFPINSAGDDFSFVNNIHINETDMGYLSSNRKGGMGNDDIYSFSFRQAKLILLLKGLVINKKTNTLLPDASVSLFANGRKLIAKQSSNENGSVVFQLEPNTDYSILGQKEKFYADSMSLNTKNLANNDTIKVTLALEPLFEVGKSIALKNILYNFDKDDIRRDAAKILDELVRTMRDNPTLEIELGSHTDSRGVDIYNLDLSQRRARSVVYYLVARGIARDRMKAKGYGETQLLNKCSNGVKCSEEAHQANRRTEFKVLNY